MDLTSLLPYATEKQAAAINAVIKHGSHGKAAAALGCDKSNISQAIKGVKKKAALAGYAPESDLNHHIPVGMALKGVSDMRENSLGKPQWLKYDVDQAARVQAFMDIVEELTNGLPALPKVKPPRESDTDKNLVNTYILTDYHIGAYCWGPETGDDWDVNIAKEVLLNAFVDMMYGSQDAEVGIFAQMGDFLHWDGLESVTPTSRHNLDADTRFHMLVDLALELCINVVHMLLTKHKKVVVIMCEGNHDLASSVWMQKAMAKIFRDNPRVEVDQTPFPYYAYEHGNVMIAFHHGHKKKNPELPALFASEPRYREMWGRCKHTYIHTGHYHHREVLENGGAVVERHGTLAGRDAFAARGGWVSARQTRVITYHKEHGEDSIKIVTPRYKK